MNDEVDVLGMVNAIRAGAELTGTNLDSYERELLRAAEKEPWSFGRDTGYCQDIEDLHALHGVDVTLAQVISFVQVGAKALGWRDVTVGGGQRLRLPAGVSLPGAGDLGPKDHKGLDSRCECPGSPGKAGCPRSDPVLS
ncbi:hypothetical protein ACFL5T_04500 [Gemmatimonadota bacterium]